MKKKVPETSLIMPITATFIERRIYVIRGQKVMLSSDLAELYQVEPRALIQMVKRNQNRFPSDFMFQLSFNEATALKSQIVISNVGRGGRRYPPYAFTELGVAMLSSVLKSDRAVQMNIYVMRSFVKLRELLATNKELAEKIQELERGQKKHGEHLVAISSALKRMMDEPIKPKGKIGFDI